MSLYTETLIQRATQTCATCNENEILHCEDICCHCGVTAYWHPIGHCGGNREV